MNWPAPTLEPPTFRPPVADDAAAPVRPADESAETPQERLRLSAVPAAAWVAVLGGSLVLLAAAIVVTSNWDALGRGVRTAGLMLATAGLIVAAERLRRPVPTTARVVASVGTFLTATCGIAAMSLLGVTWPACLLVGGALAIVATEVQARRWGGVTFQIGQVGAIALASTGLAALTSTSGGVIAAVAGLGLLVAGAQRRAAGVAVLAVLSPVLTALADAEVGAGTLERAGLVGESLRWSGPIVGVLAAMILGTVATQRRKNGVMLMAVAAPVIGVVSGLAAVDGPAVAWLSVPAMIVIAAELGWWLLPDERSRTSIGSAFDVIGGSLAAIGIAAPWIVTEIDLTNVAAGRPWAIPAVVTTLAVALSIVRWRSDDRRLADVGIAAAVSTAIATLLALGAPPVAVALAAVPGVAIGAYLSRRLHPIAIYVPAYWAAVSIAELEPASGRPSFVLGVALAITLLAILASTRARRAAEAGWRGWVEVALTVVLTAGLAAEFVQHDGAVAAMIGATAAAVALVLAAHRLAAVAVATLALVGLGAGIAATDGATLEPTYWIGWAAVAAGLAVLWWRTESPVASYGSASAVVIALATSAAGLHVSAEQFVMLALAATAALTGLAAVLRRRTPLDAAAVSAGACLAVASWFDIDPAWVSGIWFAIGLQLLVHGLTSGSGLLRIGGAFTTVLATASWWFTTGFDEWAVRLLEPADIRVGDLWMLAATVAALLAGWALRTTLGVNSWVAYAAGLLVAGLWLTSVQIERDTVWAIPLALTIGTAAAAVGAWRRLAAPLVGGTVLIAVTVFVAAGSDLGAVPTWSWLAAGGLVLLVVAVLIERTGRPGTADLRQLMSRWD